MKRILPIIFLLVFSASCSIQKAATTMTAKIVQDGMVAIESENDLWIAKESIIPMVKVMEVFGAGDPENTEFQGLMARVYGNVAFGFFEPKLMSAKGEERLVWGKRVEKYYREGSEAGMRSLEGRFGKGISGSISDFEKAIGKAKEKDLMRLFWTAFDLGSLVNLNRDDITSVALLPKVNMMVDRVVEVDPGFGYGSALAFKAAMLASRPKMLGGNPDVAKGIFEEAIQKSDGKYLMTKVMFAEWYAIPQGQKELSSRLLKEVIDSDPNILPEQALANSLAIERAKILISKK